MRVIIWGTGKAAREFVLCLSGSKVDIVAVTDNDSGKWGRSWKSYSVISPQEIMDYSFDCIVIASSSYESIREQIRSIFSKPVELLCYSENAAHCFEYLNVPVPVLIETHHLENDVLKTDIRRYRIHRKVTEDISAPFSAEEQRPLIKQLHRAYRDALEGYAEASEPYQPGKNWKGVFRNSRKEFYSMIESDNIAGLTEQLNHFCRNSLSTYIMGGKERYERFKKSGVPEWLEHNFKVWAYSVGEKTMLEEAEMPPIGNPYGFDIEGILINSNCFPNHYRAHFIAQLVRESRNPVIAEIGGGFGGFAYYLINRGENLTYINFDLPENLIVSSYYLSMAFPDFNILYYQSPDQILDEQLLNEYDILLMPNYMLPKLDDHSVDCFINTISFSEMEIGTVREYFRQMERIGKKYVYHENLACRPGYRGYPVSVFPRINGFSEQFKAISRWKGFDAYSGNHVYHEQLFVRQ